MSKRTVLNISGASILRDSYQNLGDFYDLIVGDRIEVTRYVQRTIKKYARNSESVLEVACGTGSILVELQKRYSVAGLDFSETMLRRAAEKTIDVPLYLGDMRQFSIDQKFDVALCMFDSINHLTKASDWKKTFRCIRKHLADDGLFVFDMNTIIKLERLAVEPPLVHEFAGNTYILDVAKKGKGRFHWNARIFSPVADDFYTCVDDSIPEAVYPVSKVKEWLTPCFKVLAIEDFERGRRSSRSERLYFICKAR